MARRTTASTDTIGIGVYDTFLSGGPHNVAVNVTYLNNSTNSWTLVYDNGAGTTSLTVDENISSGGDQQTNDGKVRTQQFCISDFHADAAGENDDFQLVDTSNTVPFMFVQLWKTEACN